MTYRRRSPADGGVRVVLPDGRVVDNSVVVPYNPALSFRYQCHLNTEICTSLGSIKYLFKYITKPADHLSVRLSANGTVDGLPGRDEVTEYIDGRYVTPPEAIWRIMGFETFEKSHTIYRLPIHLPGQQRVVHGGNRESAAAALERNSRTQLTAFFELNLASEVSQAYLYHEMPMHYTWNERDRRWAPRRQGGGRTLGRMYSAHPACGERFYLRLLLTHVRGSASFEDLRTMNGQLHDSFQAACRAHGLLHDDQEWIVFFQGAVITDTPNQLRRVFVFLLRENGIGNAAEIWQEFKDYFSEDFAYRRRQREHLAGVTETAGVTAVDHDLALREMYSRLPSSGSGYGLPACPPRNPASEENMAIPQTWSVEEQEQL